MKDAPKCLSNTTIDDIDEDMLKSDIGERLKIFRGLVGATGNQLAVRLNKKSSHIKAIEKGKKFPDCADLFYLGKKYGLNPTWLISGKGKMFDHRGPHTDDHAFKAGNTIDYKNPGLLQWAELFKLMGVPAISEEILHTFKNAKRIFANEIKLYYHQNKAGGRKKKTRSEEDKKRRRGGRMDVKGSVKVILLIVIILLIFLVFFYAEKSILFARNNRLRPER